MNRVEWVSGGIILGSVAALIFKYFLSKAQSDEDYLKQYFKELELDNSKEAFEVPAFTDHESGDRNSKVETITLDRTSNQSNSLFSSYYPSQATHQQNTSSSHEKTSNGPDIRDSILSFVPK